jgi:uncharacterized phage protein (TIGR01671 family)
MGMRTIKFRGMDVNGNWYYGNLAILPEKIKGTPVEAGSYISNLVGMPFAYQVRPETVGQHLGLKDKKGSAYYEDDIAELRYINPINGKEVVERYRVRISDNTLIKLYHHSGEQRWDRYLYMEYDNLEIIGNIYSNPELLEVKA